MGLDIVSAVEKGSLAIAHRGARSLAPENTLAAAQKALSLGADMWELDVRMSGDGRLVVVHDPTLERTSDVSARFAGRKPWRVHDFSLDELKSLDFGSWFNGADPFGQIAAGAVSREEQGRYRAEALPTLEEAILFTLGNGWLVNVEIKDLAGTPGDKVVAERVADLVQTLEAAPNVLVSSFNRKYLARVKERNRNIATGLLVYRARRDALALMRELGALTYHPRMSALRPEQFREWKASGFHTLVWVINDPELARVLWRAGAAGVFTDFPQDIRQIPEKNHENVTAET